MNQLDQLLQANLTTGGAAGQVADSESYPRPRTGRRELRAALLARGVIIHANPATEADRQAAARGELAATLPVRRKEPKRGGLSKKEWKRARRAARAKATEQTQQSPTGDSTL
jgi:hypothetical protein